MRVLIALATYNERENLPSLLDEILRTVSGADILIVDYSPTGPPIGSPLAPGRKHG